MKTYHVWLGQAMRQLGWQENPSEPDLPQQGEVRWWGLPAKYRHKRSNPPMTTSYDQLPLYHRKSRIPWARRQASAILCKTSTASSKAALLQPYCSYLRQHMEGNALYWTQGPEQCKLVD